MRNMKKLTLSVFILTFGLATATHAQQVKNERAPILTPVH